MDFIPYGRQDINERDIESVVDVLRSDWLTQGPAIQQFEKAVANYCTAEYAVAVANGTAALHLSCLALGVGPGDIVWTSPNTFVASANCARYCGANVDFVDIDSKTYNMSVTALERKLEKASKEDRLPKVVIPVHFAGQSCVMQGIRKLADQYSFKIIEDACHAIGGKYRDEMIGSCRYSDIVVFSFHPVKNMTSGEGGLALTNQKDLAEKLAQLRTHGITRDTEIMQYKSEGPWYYEQLDLGFNYRVTDIQAALGLSQLSRLDEFIQKRRALVNRYNQALANLPITMPFEAEYCHSAWHLYMVRVDPNERRRIFEAMRKANIGVNVLYIPVHTQPYYQQLGFSWSDFPNAETYYRSAIALPLFPTLTHKQQDYVIQQLKDLVCSNTAILS